MTAQRAERPLRYGELDRETVVAAVLRLARASGVESVTMRAVAAELGTSPAAVYYHVPNKAALLDLVADAVLSAVAVPAAGPWDDRLRSLYESARRELVAVAGIAGVLQSRPLAASGRALDSTSRAILADAGLDRTAARAAHRLLYTYLLGGVMLEHSVGSRPAASAQSFRFGLDVILAGLREKGARP